MTVMMEMRSALMMAACWLIAQQRAAAAADLTSSGQYELVTDEGGQAVCAVSAASEQVTARSTLGCMNNCLQLSGCIGANFANKSSCQIYRYYPKAFSVQAGCKHYQVRYATLPAQTCVFRIQARCWVERCGCCQGVVRPGSTRSMPSIVVRASLVLTIRGEIRCISSRNDCTRLSEQHLG